MMVGRRERVDGVRTPTSEPDETFDITGELIRVTDDDVQAGILSRLAYNDKDWRTSGLISTVIIAGLCSQIAPWWQVACFVVARFLAVLGNAVLIRRVQRRGVVEALRDGYLTTMELWLAAIALSWSCVIFLTPSPWLEHPTSVLALLAVFGVENVIVHATAFSPRTVAVVTFTFWISVSLRAVVDHSEYRPQTLVFIAIYQGVLAMHALNLQRQNVRSVRSEIINRTLHDRVKQQHDQLAQVNTQLGAALEQSTELASYDPLTGILNRRAFLAAVTGELTRMRSHHESSSVVLLDLDGFKSANDNYGHIAGDEVLATCSLLLRDEMRASDIVARWGGDEFIVLLPNTSPENAAACAERYRAALKGATSATWPEQLHISASLGVAELRHDVGFDEALAAADHALYRAKHEGRNAVCVAPTTARPS